MSLVKPMLVRSQLRQLKFITCSAPFTVIETPKRISSCFFVQSRKSEPVAIFNATYWSPEASSARFIFAVSCDCLCHVNEPVFIFIFAVPEVSPERSNSLIDSSTVTVVLTVVPKRLQVAVHSPSLTFVKVTLPSVTVSSTSVCPSFLSVSVFPLNFSFTVTSPEKLSFLPHSHSPFTKLCGAREPTCS